METKFLDRILGALIAAPIIDVPVRKIPQAAPITLRASERAIPRPENMYGSREANAQDQEFV